MLLTEQMNENYRLPMSYNNPNNTTKRKKKGFKFSLIYDYEEFPIITVLLISSLLMCVIFGLRSKYSFDSLELFNPRSALEDITTSYSHTNDKKTTEEDIIVTKWKVNDMNLEFPFLDTLTRNWNTSGNPIVKNTQHVKLTSRGEVNNYGVMINKNHLPQDFELQVKFSLDPGYITEIISKSPGDGMAFFFTSKPDFIFETSGSSYANRQYMIENEGLDPKNRELMGIPKNLPSETLVLDFMNYHTNEKNDKVPQAPFLNFVSTDIKENRAYDYSEDGVSCTHGFQKLSPRLLFSTRDNLKEINLRFIRISGVFFKIDIDYSGFGLDWMELYKFDNLTEASLPQLGLKDTPLYFGISSLNGEKTSNFRIHDVTGYSLDWDNRKDLLQPEEQLENVLKLYRDEIYSVYSNADDINNEYHLHQMYDKAGLLSPSKEDGRTEIIDSSNSFFNSGKKNNNNSKKKYMNSRVFKILMITWIFLFLGVIFYVASLYLRVAMKKKIRNFKKSKQVGLLG
ncbi:Uip5p SCDLUD_005108 [Saccharomycodes ludwigii]|uniref:Uip5p n=1 Tax=Saccharomycodes ludwigii TaxID=36035 RepID=UPI001E89C88A|nr:hypothetical protein SCDLUD_005108 [Saccharomycodes ludwigii]KAH3898773.1 hypothetical protein SCDLUD_005108 [Saccharomycodes ludwigii]